jgi:hypothetical protein
MWKATEEVKGKGKGTGKANVEQTPGEEGLQSGGKATGSKGDTEGQVVRVYLEPDQSPAVSSSSSNETDSTEELSGKSDSEHDSDVDMNVEDDVDALYHIDLDGDLDMQWDGDHN